MTPSKLLFLNEGNIMQEVKLSGAHGQLSFTSLNFKKLDLLFFRNSLEGNFLKGIIILPSLASFKI